MIKVIKRLCRRTRNIIRRTVYPLKRRYYKTKLLRCNRNRKEMVNSIDLKGYKYVYPYLEKKGYYSYQEESAGQTKYELSIIIPVYNSEKYLENCLESLFNQETAYKYELVIIDDGSTDKSSSIIEKYVCRDNVKVISQENHGISFSRNKGVALSEGKYIGFVDNDDAVTNDYVETLMKVAESCDADIVKCGHIMHLSDGDEIVFCNSDAQYSKGLGVDITKYNGYIWGGITKRELWKEISFPEGYWYEDMVTRFMLYSRVNTFIYVGRTLYHKYEHTSNASRTIWSQNNIKCLDQVFLVKSLLIRCQEINKKYDTQILKSVLREFGTLLNDRCKAYLDTAFYCACEVINENIRYFEYDENDMTFGEQQLLDSYICSDIIRFSYVIKYLQAGGN